MKCHDALTRAGKEYRIVVLDDGSSDGTAAAAARLSVRYPLTLLKHEKNQGLGRTLKDGLEYLADHSAPDDIVVTMDCDDTHEPRYILEAVRKLERGHDLVILSRYAEGGGEEGLSAAKSLMSRGAGIFLKAFFPIRGLREYSCGYRVMRASALKKARAAFGDLVRLTGLGFAVCPEFLVRMRMLGARITEVPFTLRYDQKKSPSKNRPLKTILGYFAIVCLYCGRRAPRA